MMQEGTRTTGAARLLWPLVLGLGLALGLLWGLMPHSAVEAQSGGPGDDTTGDGDSIIALIAQGAEGIELPVRVNYAHDWIEGRTLPHYTAVVTVADVSGVKATLLAQADHEGEFQTDDWRDDWVPDQPDIEPGDVVTFASIGYVGTVDPVGTIKGELDADSDTISGTIHAPWFSPQTLDVRCMVWVDDGPDDIEVPGVAADGGHYFCDFSGMWDIEQGQDVAVQYTEPDGSEVINVFEEPAPDMRVEKWSEGEGEAGGPAVFTIRYRNEGEAEAETVLLTDTLPAGTSYITDSSGFPVSVGGGLVVWSFGPVAANDGGQFQILLSNTASSSDTLHNEADIYSPHDDHEWNDHAETESHVGAGQPDLHVNKNANPRDPAPGQTFLYEIDYGNQGPVASGPVVLTDTLPEDTTIVSWYSDNDYDLWSEVMADESQLVLTAPTIPGNWGDRIRLRLQVSDTITYGTQLTNTVQITTAGDSNPGNNWDMNDDVRVNPPRWNMYLNKEWGGGQLVPGKKIRYNVYYNNSGNVATQAWLTDTLPEGTTFLTATRWTGYGEVPVKPSYVGEGIVVWDVGLLEPGDWSNLDFYLAISPTVAPGTAITNCATIAMDQPDSWPSDNTKCVVETVRAPGPNLRVRKEARWDSEDRLDYSLRFENLGTTRMEDIWITDTYPVSTTFNGDWWVEWGPWITITHDAASRQLIFWVEDLSPGNTAGTRFRADVDAAIEGVQGLIFTNTVEAPWPGDVYPGDNTAVEVAYAGPDVYVEKRVSGGEPGPGETVTFTVEFGNRNNGWSSDNRYGSRITDTLPAAMEFITATAANDPTQPWKPDAIDGNTLSWGWGTMWSNSTWYFDIIVRITDTVGAGAVLTNTIEAYGDSPDDVEPTYDNNVSFAIVTMPGAEIYLPIVMRNF